VTAQKLKLAYLGVGIMEDSLLKVFKKNNDDFGKMLVQGERSESTYYKYKIVYNHVTEFIKSRYHRDDMALRELTCDFIRELDFFLSIVFKFTHNCSCVYPLSVYRVAVIAVNNVLIR